MSGLELVATVGAVQGFLLLVLVGLRFRRRENLPLAVLLLVYSVRMGTIPLWNPATMTQYPWLFPVTTPLPFLFGPLLWWYTHELSDDSGVRTRPTVFLHFLPYLVDLGFTILLLTIGGTERYAGMIGSIFAGNPPLHLLIRNGAKVVVNVVYTGLAIRRAFQRAPAAEMTSHQRMWLRWLVTAPVVSLVLFGFVALHPGPSAGISVGSSGPFTLLAIAMAGLIYIFSALIIVAPEVPSGHTLGRRRRREPGSGHTSRMSSDPLRPANATPRNGDVPGGGRVASPGAVFSRTTSTFKAGHVLSDAAELQSTCERLHAYLATGAFRDADLSLESAAAAIGVHPNRLSHAINQICGSSFPAAVNQRRIEFFVAQAEAGELGKRTILDLAFDAGFSSKSTFNRVFHNLMGMSPSQFRSRREQGSGV
jgi:AraC-like DNA-binding protein